MIGGAPRRYRHPTIRAAASSLLAGEMRPAIEARTPCYNSDEPLGRSSNGKTADSGSAYRGSSPCLPASPLCSPLLRLRCFRLTRYFVSPFFRLLRYFVRTFLHALRGVLAYHLGALFRRLRALLHALARILRAGFDGISRLISGRLQIVLDLRREGCQTGHAHQQSD